MVLKILEWVRKNSLATGLGAALLVSLGFLVVLGGLKPRDTNAHLQQVLALNDQLKSETALVKKKYKELEDDRNNILSQTKSLLTEKSKFTQIEESYEELKKTDQALLSQKEKLSQENQKLRRERDATLSYLDRLKGQYEKSLMNAKMLTSEVNQLKRALADKVENSPQFRSLDKEDKAFKAENAKLKSTIKTLENKIKKDEEKIKKLTQRELTMKKQILVSEKNLKTMKNENEIMRRTNAAMNQTVQEAPKRFSQMAVENKALRKETSEMHYNLGVFYSKHREIAMAVNEFQRSLDIDPNNAKSHYNLGYLYSEQLEKHEEAMAHFQRFLEISPNAQEAETARSYLLVRQTYGDKMAKPRS